MGGDISETERTSEKGWLEIQDWGWGFSVHFVLGFQDSFAPLF